MFYESELRFLCDTLKKLRIKISFSSVDEIFSNMFDETFSKIFGSSLGYSVAFTELYGNVEPFKLYKLTDSLKFCYLFFILPETEPERVMIIGPYLSAPVDNKHILETCEKYGIAPKNQKVLSGYYQSITQLSDNSHIFFVIDTFCERIWGGYSGFALVDINRELSPPDASFPKERGGEDVQSLMAHMDIMQKRYDFENELISAVSKGREHKAAQLLRSFGEMSFERRLSDPVRNLKNYGIIMNTLLRKAAENGGVHPLYINDVSSNFALRIENVTSVNAINELMNEMFVGYCRLVRKHSMKNLSPIVKKVITLINSDLSANLTLRALAESQNISPGYLATVFKKDTGKTVTEYILEERMHLAARLLTTTSLQVQTVALYCGIMDVQYFSKLFKKHTGKTPKEYRKAAT